VYGCGCTMLLVYFGSGKVLSAGLDRQQKRHKVAECSVRLESLLSDSRTGRQRFSTGSCSCMNHNSNLHCFELT
jgi:hypothetical protein